MKGQPKFEVGQVVKTPRDLYNLTLGKITSRERILQAVEADGSFKTGGLCFLETTINSIQVPFEYDKENFILKIHSPRSEMKLSGGDVLISAAKTEVYKFKGWAYTVSNERMNSVFSERSLKLL